MADAAERQRKNGQLFERGEWLAIVDDQIIVGIVGVGIEFFIQHVARRSFMIECGTPRAAHPLLQSSLRSAASQLWLPSQMSILGPSARQ